MNPHQIQALLTGAIALFVGWQLVLTLMRGEVTISLSGRGVKRAEDPKGYWSWTGVMIILEVVVVLNCLMALARR
jgi:hypothetical protein